MKHEIWGLQHATREKPEENDGKTLGEKAGHNGGIRGNSWTFLSLSVEPLSLEYRRR